MCYSTSYVLRILHINQGMLPKLFLQSPNIITWWFSGGLPQELIKMCEYAHHTPYGYQHQEWWSASKLIVATKKHVYSKLTCDIIVIWTHVAS